MHSSLVTGPKQSFSINMKAAQFVSSEQYWKCICTVIINTLLWFSHAITLRSEANIDGEVGEIGVEYPLRMECNFSPNRKVAINSGYLIEQEIEHTITQRVPIIVGIDFLIHSNLGEMRGMPFTRPSSPGSARRAKFASKPLCLLSCPVHTSETHHSQLR